MVLPGALEFRLVVIRAVARQEHRVALDAGLDEILRGFLEDRMPLFGIGLQQCVAAPAVEFRGKLPAQIGDVIESVVEPVTAIGRVRMCGVAGDEGAADLIGIGNGDARSQKPT